MEAMGLYDLDSSLSGQIQIDETYFNLNMKGYKKLPRPFKKRETRSAVDDHDRILIETTGAGNPGADSIITALDGKLNLTASPTPIRNRLI